MIKFPEDTQLSPILDLVQPNLESKRSGTFMCLSAQGGGRCPRITVGKPRNCGVRMEKDGSQNLTMGFGLFSRRMFDLQVLSQD